MCNQLGVANFHSVNVIVVYNVYSYVHHFHIFKQMNFFCIGVSLFHLTMSDIYLKEILYSHLNFKATYSHEMA